MIGPKTYQSLVKEAKKGFVIYAGEDITHFTMNAHVTPLGMIDQTGPGGYPPTFVARPPAIYAVGSSGTPWNFRERHKVFSVGPDHVFSLQNSIRHITLLKHHQYVKGYYSRQNVRLS
jgi:hypothetical protein